MSKKYSLTHETHKKCDCGENGPQNSYKVDSFIHRGSQNGLKESECKQLDFQHESYSCSPGSEHELQQKKNTRNFVRVSHPRPLRVVKVLRAAYVNFTQSLRMLRRKITDRRIQAIHNAKQNHLKRSYKILR